MRVEKFYALTSLLWYHFQQNSSCVEYHYSIVTVAISDYYLTGWCNGHSCWLAKMGRIATRLEPFAQYETRVSRISPKLKM